MDELRVKLSTKFMKTIVSKWMARSIRKKYGYKVDIRLNDLDITSFNGDTDIRANVEIKLASDEFIKIMKELDLD